MDELKYKERTRRITFDTPISLRDKIHSIIPPSTLSSIMRSILQAIIKLHEKEGAHRSLTALLSNNFEIIIKKTENFPNESELIQRAAGGNFGRGGRNPDES